MPCAEIADAIVQTGRTTLERAMRMVDGTAMWGARVVYGDTDSMFVVVPGRTVAQAWRIGEQIAAAVTADNPHPVALKLEKVYASCTLVSKKRYAGWMHEGAHDEAPSLDVKGLEMVRRDSCPAVAKAMRRALTTLFTTHDLSAVKTVLVKQWTSLLNCTASIADHVFAKEVRLGSYSEGGTLPPSAVVASKAMLVDPRAEPRYGERVSFVVVHGPPRARLIDLVVPPETLLDPTRGLRLNATYYITKQIIPALARVLHLCGADVASWFAEMRKPRAPTALAPSTPRALSMGRSAAVLASDLATEARDRSEAAPAALTSVTIDRHFLSRACDLCGSAVLGNSLVCAACAKDSQRATYLQLRRRAVAEQALCTLQRICLHCTGDTAGSAPLSSPSGMGAACRSLACPVLYARARALVERTERHWVADVLKLLEW